MLVQCDAYSFRDLCILDVLEIEVGCYGSHTTFLDVEFISYDKVHHSNNSPKREGSTKYDWYLDPLNIFPSQNLGNAKDVLIFGGQIPPKVHPLGVGHLDAPEWWWGSHQHQVRVVINE